MTARGTSNGNASGSAADRRRRKEWLLATYAADLVAVADTFPDGHVEIDFYTPETAQSLLKLWADWNERNAVKVQVEIVPACRCYRCGKLLSFDTLTVDRIVPGCLGGTYRRTNIRPACGSCNSITGNTLQADRREKIRHG